MPGLFPEPRRAPSPGEVTARPWVLPGSGFSSQKGCHTQRPQPQTAPPASNNCPHPFPLSPSVVASCDSRSAAPPAECRRQAAPAWARGRPRGAWRGPVTGASGAIGRGRAGSRRPERDFAPGHGALRVSGSSSRRSGMLALLSKALSYVWRRADDEDERWETSGRNSGPVVCLWCNF